MGSNPIPSALWFSAPEFEILAVHDDGHELVVVTAVVDVGTGRIVDVFEGRDAADLRAWLACMPAGWLAEVQVVSVDPHEGYRSAVVRPDPRTGRASPLADATVVVDPFHIVRVRHEAPCVRGRVRDPPLRPVAAGR